MPGGSQEEKAFRAEGTVQAKVWKCEWGMSLGCSTCWSMNQWLTKGLVTLVKNLSVSLSLDLASPQPTPGSALLGRGKVMAVLLLEAKPSLEAKVKDRRSGASALRAPPHVGLPRAPALLQTSAPHVDVVHTQLLGWRC